MYDPESIRGNHGQLRGQSGLGAKASKEMSISELRQDAAPECLIQDMTRMSNIITDFRTGLCGRNVNCVWSREECALIVCAKYVRAQPHICPNKKQADIAFFVSLSLSLSHLISCPSFLK